MWTLWVLLLSLPLIVLVVGCVSLLHNRNRDSALPHTVRQSLALIHARMATLFVAVATLAAGGILAIVVLHMLAN